VEGGAVSEELTALVERLRQREEWPAGGRTPAEEHLAPHPELRRDTEAALEVIYHEVLLRARAGEAPVLEEHLARFPD
jgi:hypothetical protein